MGEYLLKYYEEDLKAGDTITICCLLVTAPAVSKQRTRGMLDILDANEYKDQFKQLQEGFQTDWSNAKSQEFMENWLQHSGR